MSNIVMVPEMFHVSNGMIWNHLSCYTIVDPPSSDGSSFMHDPLFSYMDFYGITTKYLVECSTSNINFSFWRRSDFIKWINGNGQGLVLVQLTSSYKYSCYFELESDYDDFQQKLKTPKLAYKVTFQDNSILLARSTMNQLLNEMKKTIIMDIAYTTNGIIVSFEDEDEAVKFKLLAPWEEL
jgi:hypothetical protein